MENLDYKLDACAYIDEKASVFEETADYIWDHPELSLKESQATSWYCEKLKELGFEVTENLCGIRTAFSGTYGSGRPYIGILGEYDALSGLSQKAGQAVPEPVIPGGSGHGCGHNLLGAGSLAAAAAVKNFLKSTGQPGTVIFLWLSG